MKNLILLIACSSLLSCEKSMNNLEMAEQSKYSADTRVEARTECLLEVSVTYGQMPVSEIMWVPIS